MPHFPPLCRKTHWICFLKRLHKEYPVDPEQQVLQADEAQILAFAWEHGSITNIECRTLLAINAARVYYWLKKLSSSWQLQSKGTGRWRKVCAAMKLALGLSRVYPQ